MPTLHLYRRWCKSCSEYTLHTKGFDHSSPMICKVCKSVFVETPIEEIPEEHLIEQRKRYKEHERASFGKMYREFINPGYDLLKSMLAPPGSDVEINEDDAGQREIDEENRIRDNAIRMERKRLREEKEVEMRKYAQLGRNDVCLCGSGLKYKKCHLKIFETP